jgi:molybdate transport system substrate-binding protein
MAGTLQIISAGAAQGLVRRLQAEFEAKHDCRLEGTFGAVGLMKEKLLGGAACDVLILTQAQIDELGAEGQVDASTAHALGRVKTGLAVKTGRAPVPVRSAEDLKSLLQAAPAIYFPDPAKATAGIHFMKVLRALGLADDPQRLRTYPNGATAMAELARAPEPQAVGCTQVTEILITEGVQLTGLLPPPHELSTTYAAAVTASAQDPELARALIAALTAADQAQVRKDCGFE